MIHQILKSLAIIISSLVFVQCSDGGIDSVKENNESTLFKPVISSDWVHIFNPNDDETRFKTDTSWYTNDHSFVKGSDGKWHAYGIIGHLPIDPWKEETNFFHISADSILSNNWQDHGYALSAKEGVEKVLWAPYVYKENGLYTMFYNSGNLNPNANDFASWGNLNKATSTDMFNWKRHDYNPLFSDPGHARDSYILKHNNEYLYYYTATVNSVDLRSTVMLRTSTDLDRWSGPRIVHTETPYGHWGGNTESPFVVKHEGKFYLFVCYASKYNTILVYWSDTPYNFPMENLVTKLEAHAPEIIDGGKEGLFISTTGWDKKGLYIADLKWEEVK